MGPRRDHGRGALVTENLFSVLAAHTASASFTQDLGSRFLDSGLDPRSLTQGLDLSPVIMNPGSWQFNFW